MKFKRILKLNYLLMWKNFKGRKAHPFLSCLEIGLPLGLIVLFSVVWFIAYKSNNAAPSKSETGDQDHTSPSPNENRTALTTPLPSSSSTSSSTSEAQTTFFDTSTSEEEFNNETSPDPYGKNEQSFDQNKTDLSNITLVYSPKNAITEGIIGRIPKDLFADIKGFDTESQIEEFWAEMILKYGNAVNYIDFNEQESIFKMIGIVFKSGFDENDPNKKISYIIRPSEHMQNKLMFSNHEEQSSKSSESESEGPPKRKNMYEPSGFLILQKFIDEAIIIRENKKPGRSIDSNETDPETTSTIQEFKYTVTDTDSALNKLGKQQSSDYPLIFTLLFCMAFMCIIFITITHIVNEREVGLQEFLEMKGIPKWIQILQWFINSLIINIFIVLIATVCVLYALKIGDVSIILLPFYTMFIAIFCYVLAATAFSMLIASLFNKATIANAVGSLLWLASFFVFSNDFAEMSSYPVSRQVCTAFVPNMALFQIFVAGAERSMNQGTESTSAVSPWAFIGMLLLSTLIFILLALYFQQVMPSDIGIPKPWHFLFTKCCTSKPSKVKDSDEAGSKRSNKRHTDPKAFEPDPTNLPVGIKIKNLQKSFGKKIAVDGLTLKIYKGQITALLGHNGAGKTTTISILTGSLKSSSGKAYLDDMDIDKDMAKIRQNLGFCPQHNVLFKDLTGRDQLIFFAALKGISIKAAKKEVDKFGERTNLKAYFHKRPSQISGGQKRQLQLGIALIGNPSIVILDEPTSGMDPETRRSVWDVLQKFRKDRTIILTTHHMEEADSLGDRVAIMSMGNVQCVGTPNYLKKLYGDGYTLKMTIKDSKKNREILDLVKTYVPKAKFGISNSKHELIINISDRENITVKLPAMFRALTEKKKELGIVDIGFLHTTMEDVFIKVGELSEGKEEVKDHDLDNIWIGGKDLPKVKNPAKLFFQRLYALFLKRAKVFSRSYGVILITIIVPVLFIIVGFLLGENSSKFEPPEEPLEIQPSLYNDKWTILYKSENSPNLEKILKSIVGSSNAEAIQIPFEEKINEIQSKVKNEQSQVDDFKNKYIFGVKLVDDKILTGFNSKTAVHSGPLVQNIFSNILLKNVNPALSIEVTSHPMDMQLATRFHYGHIEDTNFALFYGFPFAGIVSIGLCLLAACFVLFPAEENYNQSKHLQFMSGVSPALYHTFNLMWDLFIVLLIYMIVIIVVYCINTGTYTSMNGPVVFLLIMVVFCLCLAVFAYLYSLIGQLPTKAFNNILYISILTGLLLAFIINIPILAMIFRRIEYKLFPMYNVIMALLCFSARSIANSRCSRVLAKDLEVMCRVKDIKDANITRMCCENCENLTQVEPSPKCFKMTAYDDRIYFEIIWVFILGVIFFITLMLIEYLGCSKCGKKVPEVVGNKKQDEDVKKEAKRIYELVNNRDFTHDQILVLKLTKMYKEFIAVKNISFGVHKGECFGLLGVNGAGKTTVFSMLVNLIKLTSGNAHSAKGSLMKNRQAYLKEIGYCPQIDPIWKILSGKELLVIFALIRGVPFKQCKVEAQNWLNRFGKSAIHRLKSEIFDFYPQVYNN